MKWHGGEAKPILPKMGSIALSQGGHIFTTNCKPNRILVFPLGFDSWLHECRLSTRCSVSMTNRNDELIKPNNSVITTKHKKNTCLLPIGPSVLLISPTEAQSPPKWPNYKWPKPTIPFDTLVNPPPPPTLALSSSLVLAGRASPRPQA